MRAAGFPRTGGKDGLMPSLLEPIAAALAANPGPLLPKVLGGVALGLLLVYSILAALKRQPKGRVLKLPYPPRRFHLVPLDAVPWQDGETVRAHAAALSRLGFQEVGRYEPRERPGQ